MNILFVTLGFIPGAWGGVASSTHASACELQQQGHRVTVCASNLFDKYRRVVPGSSIAELDGIRVVRLHMHTLRQWPGTVGPTFVSPRTLRWLWREVRSADVIHLMGTRDILTLAAAVFARRQGKPFVLHPHGALSQIMNSIRIKHYYDLYFTYPLVRAADALIATQSTEVEQILQAGGELERIHIVPNALDNREFTPERYRGQFRAHFRIPADRRIILFLARIHTKKGADILVEAFAQMRADQRMALHLVIAGPDGGQLDEVHALVNRYGLEEHVTFTGLVSGAMVTAAHVDADLFVLPCRADTFPMALIEACQASTPIVLFDTCEIADLLADRAALITPVDATALADAMSELLQNATLRERFQRGAGELMQTVFSIEATTAQFESIYLTTIAARLIKAT